MASFVLETAMRNALADAFDTQVGTTATLEFQTVGSTEVATLSLSNPAFGASSTGVITLAGVPLSDTDAAGGTMTKFVIKAAGTTIQCTGDVATSSASINFAGGTTVGAGDTVTLTAFTVTVPAGT
jgi:hypothetical protein